MIARDSVWPTMSQRSQSEGGLGREIWQADTQHLKGSVSESERGREGERERSQRDEENMSDKVQVQRKRAGKEHNKTKEMTQPGSDREP